MSILDYYRRLATPLGDLNIRNKTLAGVDNILRPTSVRSANNLLDVMPEEKGISIGLLDAAPTVEELMELAGRYEQKTPPPQKGILSGLLTGEGTSDRLRGLAAGLLTGAQATPVSFGQSLVKGLLTGDQLSKEAEKMRLLKEESEREKRYKEAQIAKLQREALAPADLGDLYNITYRAENGKLESKAVSESQVTPFLNDPNFVVTKVGTGTELGETPTLAPQVIEAQEQGLGATGLSKDSVINPDGSVTIKEGSKTAIDLGLKQDQLNLSKEEYNQKVYEFEQNYALDMAKQKVDEQVKLGNLQLSQKELEMKVQKEARDIQNARVIERRKEDGAYSELGKIVRTIDAIENTLNQNKDSFIGVVGPGSFLAEIPVFGPSTPQGVLKNQAETLISMLAAQSLANLKSQSRTGATGFGQLSQKELELIQSLQGKLDQATSYEQFERVLNDIKTRLNAAYYGVLNKDGVIETYSPLKHDRGLFDKNNPLKIATDYSVNVQKQKVRRFVPGNNNTFTFVEM